MMQTCISCQIEYEARRRTSKYCGERCRKRAQRTSKAPAAPEVATDPKPASAGLSAAYRAALADANRIDTPLGQHVLALAEAMESPFETGSGRAALSKQLQVVFDAAMKGAAVADPLDQLRERRERKQRAG